MYYFQSRSNSKHTHPSPSLFSPHHGRALTQDSEVSLGAVEETAGDDGHHGEDDGHYNSNSQCSDSNKFVIHCRVVHLLLYTMYAVRKDKNELANKGRW